MLVTTKLDTFLNRAAAIIVVWVSVFSQLVTILYHYLSLEYTSLVVSLRQITHSGLLGVNGDGFGYPLKLAQASN
uniref:Uncharacterized protein n=1 Tax=Ditylenchus dipsaci TaxID=166011 RepID=A0A915EC98_9BILA